MVRASKEATIHKRIEEVFSAKIFEELLASNPRLRNRVIPVEGDIMKEEFGMSLEDQQRLHTEVTVVIHSAATTKFNEKIKLAIEMNTLGVRRMLHLARQCKKLISVVHISTCYVAADKASGTHIQDQVYQTRCTPAEVFEKLKNLSVEESEPLTQELIHPYPNTYSFTKALGEQIVLAERGNLPLCILRPSIVTASWLEPLPGWIDVMFGPAGLFLAAGMGALKVMLGKSENVTDLIPVDIVCNAIIAAAWRNTKLAKEDPSFFSNLTVYHIASSTINPIRWFDTVYLVPQYFVRHRPKRNFGWPGYAGYVGNRPLFHILNYTVHYIPAAFADGLRMLQGKKPFMFRSARKLDRAMSALGHFTMNEWFFSSQTSNGMHADMSDTDKKTYNMDIRDMDWDIYFITFLHGIRRFLLKEDETSSKPGEKKTQEQGGWLKSIMNNIRSILVLMSLGCLIYFFRQHSWLLKLRAKQIRGVLQNAFSKMSTKAQALTASV